MPNNYGEFVSHVLGLLDTFGILEPLSYLLQLIIAMMGVMMFVRLIRGI